MFSLANPDNGSGEAHDRGEKRGLPIVLWSYPGSGVRLLWSVLRENPDLICTPASGIVPATGQLAHAWGLAAGRRYLPAGQMPEAAVKSLRVALTPLIISSMAASGASRLCDIYQGLPYSSEVLLRVFPGTQFIILHRNCRDVAWSTIRNPDTMSYPPVRACVEDYKGDQAAGLMQYWASHTSYVRSFAERHPESCLQLRYEDLLGTPGAVADEVSSFLGARILIPESLNSRVGANLGLPGCGVEISAPLAHGELVAQLADLHGELKYDPWPTVTYLSSGEASP